MADSPTPPLSPPAPAPPEAINQEIKIVSHSSLFYWWPIWFFGLLFALLTYIDNNRLVIVGHTSTIVKDGQGSFKINVEGNDETKKRLLADADKSVNHPESYTPKIRVSPRTWMGPVFLVVLFLVTLITNVPLRGLWSLVIILLIGMVALLLSLFEGWDFLLRNAGDLHVFINMAGYLSISVALLAAWLLVVFVFDRRTYVIFAPNQFKVCEEVGGREMVYSTMGMSLEKRRDDWFRHLILGCGTGDLTIKTSGADRHEIIRPNVAFVTFKIRAIETMMRTMQTSPKSV